MIKKPLRHSKILSEVNSGSKPLQSQLKSAKKILADKYKIDIQSAVEGIQPDTIVDLCSDVTNFTRDDILGSSRNMKLVGARRAICCLMHYQGIPTQWIGKYINRDRSTVDNLLEKGLDYLDCTYRSGQSWAMMEPLIRIVCILSDKDPEYYAPRFFNSWVQDSSMNKEATVDVEELVLGGMKPRERLLVNILSRTNRPTPTTVVKQKMIDAGFAYKDGPDWPIVCALRGVRKVLGEDSVSFIIDDTQMVMNRETRETLRGL